MQPRLNNSGAEAVHQSAPMGWPWRSWRAYRDLERTWFYACAGLFLLMVFCLLAGAIDDRLFNGVSVWSKPFKFALSLAVYFATLLAFSYYLPNGYLRTTAGRVLVVSLTWVAGIEMVYITIQSALGEASHFNTTTAFHRLMYSLMGLGAAWLVTALVWFAWVIGRNNVQRNPIALAIVVGLVLTFILGGGFGGYLGGQTSHWVNAVQSDANGVVFFNWATEGGDLRVAHFFGIHAMQAVPLFALLLPAQMTYMAKCILIAAFSSAYAGLCAFTFYQALQGQPFIG